MRKLIVLFAALSLAFAVVVAGGAVAPKDSPLGPTAASALGKLKCDVLPTGAEDNDGDVTLGSFKRDPIVYRNVEEADPSESQPHLHDFFGSRGVVAFSPDGGGYYWQIRGFAGGSGADATSCRLNTDTAGYWAPALIYTSGPKAGQRVPVQQFTAYYRGFAGQTQHAGTQAIPAGARLVASDMVGYGLSGWTCGQNSTVTGGQDTIPDCSGEDGSPGNTLTAHVNFPSCWNGVAPNHPGDPGVTTPDTEYGDTRDNDSTPGGFTSNDFIYPTNKTACPASHPIEVTQLRETVQYQYTGNGTDVALASDFNHDGQVVYPRGSTYHVDFWNTWDQAAFVDFVQRCIQTSQEANCDP